MSGIDNPGRHGAADRPPGDPSGGLSARADSGFGGRHRALGREAGRDGLDLRGLADLAERGASLARRIADHGGRRDSDADADPGSDGRATLLATAFLPPAEALPATPATTAGVAPSPTAAHVARAAERIEQALAAETAPVAGSPIALRIDLADLALPFGALRITLTRTDLDVVILGATATSAVPAGLAEELARLLATRLRGRRVNVIAAQEHTSPSGTPFGMIRSILEGEA